jgi:DNA-binding winged helix-turn-helix (wHTH) protein
VELFTTLRVAETIEDEPAVAVFGLVRLGNCCIFREPPSIRAGAKANEGNCAMESPEILKVGGLQISVSRRELLSDNGQHPKLPPKVVELLLYLAQFPNQIISRDQILGALWAGRIVEANALNQVIFQARLALCDHKSELLMTYPKRGFLLKVQDVPSAVKPSGLDAISASEPRLRAQPQMVELQTICANAEVTVDEAPRQSAVLFHALSVHWAMLAVVMICVVAFAIFFFSAADRASPVQVERQKSLTDGERQTEQNTPAVTNCAVYLSSELATELIELFSAAAKSQNKVVCFEAARELINAQLSIQNYPNAEGLIIRDQHSEDFVSEEHALKTVLRRLRSSDAKNDFRFVWSTTEVSDLNQLFSAGVTTKSVWRRILTRIESSVTNGNAWLDAALLMRLSGRNSVAAILDVDALLAQSKVKSNHAIWLNFEIEQARVYQDVQVELVRLRGVCDAVQIQNDSWMRATCLLERALAEKRASQNEALPATLALAASSFKTSGDVRSERLVNQVAKAWLESKPFNASGKNAVLTDRRVLGSQLMSIFVGNFELAYSLAQKAELLSWVRTDSVARHEALLVMSRAAIGLDDKTKLADIAKLLETRYLGAGSTGLQIAGKAALMEVYFAQNRLDLAVAVRKKMDANSKQVRPLVRCRSALIFIETGERALVNSDADFCLSVRNDRVLYAHYLGFHGWIAKIAQERLYGDAAKAIQMHDTAFVEYQRTASDQSVNNLSPEAAHARQILLYEAWALGRWDWITTFCVQPTNCDFPLIRNILLSKSAPTQLRPMTITPPQEITGGAPEFLVSLHLEQRRIGHCPIDAKTALQYRAKFLSFGNVVSLATFNGMVMDCKPGQISPSLENYPARLTY